MARTTFKNDMRVTGALTVAGASTLTGNVTASGTLAVTGAITRTAPMTAGTGITTGTGTIIGHEVLKMGSLFRTTIVIDLTGLNGGGTAADIIGVDAAANCHLGQITAAINGTIYAGRMTCLEVPTGSNADVDLYMATVATGTEDAAATSLTGQAILLNGGTWTNGLSQALTAYPSANAYLYLASGTATSATFTAGIFEIVLFGS